MSFPWEKFEILKRKCAALAHDRRELYYALEKLTVARPTARDKQDARDLMASMKRPERPMW